MASNAYLFVETSGVGGTHPALVEAMGSATCVVADDTAENRETVDSAGFVYDGASGAACRAAVAGIRDAPALVAAIAKSVRAALLCTTRGKK